jgi:hydroxymethylbilane synthase
MVDKKAPISEWKKLGFHLAQEILNAGGTQLMVNIKSQLKK